VGGLDAVEEVDVVAVPWRCGRQDSGKRPADPAPIERLERPIPVESAGPDSGQAPADAGGLASRAHIDRGDHRDVAHAEIRDVDEEHLWAWLPHLGRFPALDVTAEELPGLPYEVVFTDSLTRWLDAS
jgi:hypothetical protein